jgi:hypothetical protein
VNKHYKKKNISSIGTEREIFDRRMYILYIPQIDIISGYIKVINGTAAREFEDTFDIVG